MGAPAIADGFAVGAALLALWLDVRLPVSGARTFPRALALTVCANVLLFFIGVATAAAEKAVGPVAALLTVALPLLTFAFWTGLCLLRATVAQLLLR